MDALNAGGAPERYQIKMKAELDARLKAEADAKLPPVKEIPKEVEEDLIDTPKTKEVVFDPENPLLLKYEALPDSDIKEMAIAQKIKFTDKTFDRLKIIRLLAGV